MARNLQEEGKAILGWVIAVMLGVAAIPALSLILPFLKFLPGWLTSSLVIGLPVGFAQWIALRRSISVSAFWILTIPVGLLIAGQFIRAIPAGQTVDDESVAGIVAIFLVMGITIGLPQWFLLRRQFSTSSIWLLGSSVGLSAGFGLVLVTGLINQSELISYIIVFLVYAIATGLVLSWLLASHRKPQSNLVNAT